jgi:hypothetical protein
MRLGAGGWFTLVGLAMQFVGLCWAAYGLTDRARRHGWRGGRAHRALSWVHRRTIGRIREQPSAQPDPPYEPGPSAKPFSGPGGTDRGPAPAQGTVEARLMELERRVVGVEGDIGKVADMVHRFRNEMVSERTALLRPIDDEIGRINQRIHRLAVGELRGAVLGIAFSALGVALTFIGYCIDSNWFRASLF